MSLPERNRIWFAELSLLSVAVIWGINIPVMKIALDSGISPYALNAFRLVISALILQGAALREFRQGVRPSNQLPVWRILLYGLIVSVAYQFLFLVAVSLTSSADIALIMATVPMWTALASKVFLREKLPVISWLGLIIAFVGTIVVTLIQEASADSAVRLPGNLPPNRFAGNLVALLAALAWAGGTVFSRPMLKAISPSQLAACSATIGLPFHLLIAGHLLSSDFALLKSGSLLLCILYSGILSTGLALSLWSFGVKHAGASQAAMFQNLSPIIAIVAAWLWRGEAIQTFQAIGGTLIITGLILMRRGKP